MNRRVVITGMGAVTPIGIGVTPFRDALRKGESGAGPITRFDAKGIRSRRICEVKDFTPPTGAQFLDPFIQYALKATAEAAEMAAFDRRAVDPYRVGIVVSSSKGGLYSLFHLRDRFLKRPSAILAARVYANLVPNFACQWIARKWKLSGPAKCYVTACATGTTSIIEGARIIQEGVADYAFAGASDASLIPLLVSAYERMRVLSPEGIFPFDRRRKGFVLGEGAGVIFLETLESAQARRAKIYAEVAGFSYGSDPHHPVSFDPKEEALAHCLRELFRKMRLAPEEIDYVNLHGTGTRAGDVYETEQLKKALGKKAYSLTTSSTKSMTGHMLGASGAAEIIACGLALQGGFVPPTINLEKEDPRCDLDYTPGKAREKKLSLAVSISMGFGGHIAAIALRKV
jgi:3-oxoacyl-[acyl-carrier-protein] synthase II